MDKMNLALLAENFVVTEQKFSRWRAIMRNNPSSSSLEYAFNFSLKTEISSYNFVNS